MSKPVNRLAEFKPYVFNLSQRILYRGSEPVALPPRALAILEYLIENRDHLISRDELKTNVWSTPYMADNTIDRQVSDVRRALGEDSDGKSFIETKYKRGWRFAAEVSFRMEAPPDEKTVADIFAGPLNWVPNGAGRTGTSGAGQETRPTILSVSEKIKWRWLIKLPYMAAAAVLAAAVLVILLRKPSAEARVVKFTQVTNDGRIKSGPLVTDGKRIYFLEIDGPVSRIVSTAITGGEAVPLGIPMSTANVEDISPDGKTLLVQSFDSPGGELWTVDTSSGECRRLTGVSGDAAWAPNGKAIAISRMNSLAIGGDVNSFRKAATLASGKIHAPRWSRDGTRIRFSHFDPRNESVSLWEIDTRTSRTRLLTELSDGHELAANGAWSRDGNFYFYQAGTHFRHDLWVQPDNRKPVRLTDGPGSWSWPLPLANSSQLLAINDSSRSELCRWDFASKIWEPMWDKAAASELNYSRDGNWVVFSEPDHTIWKSKADGSGRAQLTDASLEAHQPHWSPDSRRVAFMGQKSNGEWRIFVVSADGGPPEQLSKSGDDQGVPTWSPDGRYILYGERLGRRPRAEMSLHLLDAATREVRTLVHSAGLWSPRWSPNGKYIAAITSDSKALRISGWPGNEWNEAARMLFIDNAVWSADSRYVYFNGQREVGHYELFRVDIPAVRLERVVDLRDFSLADENWFGVAPDGSPLASRGAFQSEIWELQCVLP